MSDAGQPLPDREIGEIVFAGPSVTAGYFRNPEATAATFDDGWLHTGDLGYLVKGEIFITGRKKDIIVINGRNHDPQRIEWLIDEVPGVRRGNVAAFSVPGEDSEQLVIAYESAEPDETLAAAIRRRVQTGLQLSVADVVRLEPGAVAQDLVGQVAAPAHSPAVPRRRAGRRRHSEPGSRRSALMTRPARRVWRRPWR